MTPKEQLQQKLDTTLAKLKLINQDINCHENLTLGKLTTPRIAQELQNYRAMLRKEETALSNEHKRILDELKLWDKPFNNNTKYPHEVLYMLEDPNSIYDFDAYIIGKWPDGTYFWAHDSGCSCPSPFEQVDTEPLTNKKDLDNLLYVVTQRNYGPDAIVFMRKALSLPIK